MRRGFLVVKLSVSIAGCQPAADDDGVATAQGSLVFEWPQKGSPEAEERGRAETACKQYETFNDVEPKPMTCMRDNGVDMPDPDPNGTDDPPVRDPNNPGPPAAVIEAAEAACLDKLMEARMAGTR